MAERHMWPIRMREGEANGGLNYLLVVEDGVDQVLHVALQHLQGHRQGEGQGGRRGMSYFSI